MVTKLFLKHYGQELSLILAKIHMVTKHSSTVARVPPSLILAKIHMVTKPQIHVTIYLKIIKY